MTKDIIIETIWRATWLSQMRDICVTSPNLNSICCLSQISSQVAETITLYSASTLNLATTFNVLLFQDIKLLPIRHNIQKWI